jgi:tricorn protease
MGAGYYLFPTIAKENVVFVSEDDLWTVPAGGGITRRLTSNLAQVSRPFLSPDGRHLAFVGREEGQAEVYLMPGLGGQARRLTFMGGSLCHTAGWTSDGRIIFATNAAQPFPELLYLYTLSIDGGQPQQINVGLARAISYRPGGGVVIGRNTGDPARWKRYQGGTAGQIWIDERGDGEFRPLIELKGNLASPIWMGDRVYFISDHEGVGNLYSCQPSGEDLERHTHHTDFYARNATTDGKRIVYHAGADLYLFDPATEENVRIQVKFYSPQVQRNRKFVSAAKYLESWELHPKGQSLAITSRGKLFSFANWEGAVLQHGEPQGVRCRLPRWLNDGKRMLCVTDEGGEERFAIYHADGIKDRELLPELDIGRPVDIAVNPVNDQIAFSNHRYELLLLDLESKELKRIDQGKADRIAGFAWSPDGVWLAYSVSVSLHLAVLRIWNAGSEEIHPLTEPVLRDVAPAFDPDGKYLYFLSYRHFDPVYDNLHFDLNFPRGVKPYLITLQKDAPSPFVLLPKREALKDEEKKDNEQANEGTQDAKEEQKDEVTDRSEKEKIPEVKSVQIDLEGIERRIVEFPVDEGRYGRVRGLKEGKVLFSHYPVEGALGEPFLRTEPPAKGSLWVYKFEQQEEQALIYGISDFDVSGDASTMIIRIGNHLRVLKAGTEPDEKAGGRPSRQSGWIDLNRVSVPVVPNAEWRQMFREAWRLQRDQFWAPDMSEVDWSAVHDRYLPLVDRVGSRAEFSDLMWEMQGELGTSHCYELGGDYRPEPSYQTGYLGADFDYDEQSGGWRITKIVRGDPWDEKADSSLNRPGVNLREGDRLVAVNGQSLDEDHPPTAALVNLAGKEVTLTVLAEGEESPHQVTVKTLPNEMPARYREWVEENRHYVHNATNGRVGYLHIPDMGARGYAEFHRGYLAEVDREGLIVDLRFNDGGHVSSLLLEKLARRRIGYDKQRWGEPEPYPHESVLGPIVALTNEHAGSDGDIFSHGFKLMKLGPLLGKRTWGGVVGIWPRQALVDGAFTTQPEYSFWFEDVGWAVENYGTDPDIEVDNTPQDYARGVDVQLDRSIQEVLRLMEENPPRLPDFSQRPSRALPTLPPNKNSPKKDNKPNKKRTKKNKANKNN